MSKESKFYNKNYFIFLSISLFKQGLYRTYQTDLIYSINQDANVKILLRIEIHHMMLVIFYCQEKKKIF